MRPILFLAGWIFLGAAFLAAAAEPLVAATDPQFADILVPAYDLWYAVSPRTLTLTQIRLEGIAPFLWDPVAKTLLWLPMWLLLGAPGVALVWLCRPERVFTQDMRDDLERRAEAYEVLNALRRETPDDPGSDSFERDISPPSAPNDAGPDPRERDGPEDGLSPPLDDVRHPDRDR